MVEHKVVDTFALCFLFYYAQAQPLSQCDGDVRVLLPEQSGQLNIVFKPNVFNADSSFYLALTNPNTNVRCTNTTTTTCAVDSRKGLYYATVTDYRDTGLTTSARIDYYFLDCGVDTLRTLNIPEICDTSNQECGTLRQEHIPRPGENVRLVLNLSRSLVNHPTDYVIYWINKTSNDYITFKDSTLTIENVAPWMRGQEYYVQCTTGKDLKKCTETVSLQVKDIANHTEANIDYSSGQSASLIVIGIVVAVLVLIIAVVATLLWSRNRKQPDPSSTSTERKDEAVDNPLHVSDAAPDNVTYAQVVKPKRSSQPKSAVAKPDEY